MPDEMKWTPGPWVWRGKSGSLHQIGAAPHQFGKCVLTPVYEYESGVDTQVSDPDAALIASAPDLYAALKALLGWAEGIERDYKEEWGDKTQTEDPLIIAARAALSRARESE